MAVHIKDKATDEWIRRLARIKGKSLTQTIREAVEREYRREIAKVPLIERLKPIQDRFAAIYRPDWLPADKAFFDALSGDR